MSAPDGLARECQVQGRKQEDRPGRAVSSPKRNTPGSAGLFNAPDFALSSAASWLVMPLSSRGRGLGAGRDDLAHRTQRIAAGRGLECHGVRSFEHADRFVSRTRARRDFLQWTSAPRSQAQFAHHTTVMEEAGAAPRRCQGSRHEPVELLAPQTQRTRGLARPGEAPVLQPPRAQPQPCAVVDKALRAAPSQRLGPSPDTSRPQDALYPGSAFSRLARRLAKTYAWCACAPCAKPRTTRPSSA
jgi:hypothetical protein